MIYSKENCSLKPPNSVQIKHSCDCDIHGGEDVFIFHVPVEAFLQQLHADAVLRAASEPGAGGGGGADVTGVRREEDGSEVRMAERNQPPAALFGSRGHRICYHGDLAKRATFSSHKTLTLSSLIYTSAGLPEAFDLSVCSQTVKQLIEEQMSAYLPTITRRNKQI